MLTERQTSILGAVRQIGIKKEAARYSDSILGSIGTGLVPYVGGSIQTASTAGGLLRPGANKDIEERGPELKSLVPGVGAYRVSRIRRAVADEAGDRGRNQLLHETIGPFGGLALGAGAGAAAGTGLALATGVENATPLIAGGAFVGAMVPELIALLAAASTATRTNKEQADHEKNENRASNYLPGVGTYNSFKRLGHGYKRYLGE